MKTIEVKAFLVTVGIDAVELIASDGTEYLISDETDWFVNDISTTREDAVYQLLHIRDAVTVELIDGEYNDTEQCFVYDEINLIIYRDEFTVRLHEPENENDKDLDSSYN